MCYACRIHCIGHCQYVMPGGFPYEKDGGYCWNFWKEPLRDTNLSTLKGIAPAMDHLKLNNNNNNNKVFHAHFEHPERYQNSFFIPEKVPWVLCPFHMEDLSRKSAGHFSFDQTFWFKFSKCTSTHQHIWLTAPKWKITQNFLEWG